MDEMREQRQQASAKEATKQNQEAALRRLDNERQYLKSQLATEVAHKTDLQKELAQVQKLLSDTQIQWKADVDQLKERSRMDIQQAVYNEQRLQESNIQLESEVARLQAMSKELREAFAKTRDLLRIEQAAVESGRAECGGLAEEIRVLQEEVERRTAVEAEASVLHKQQLQAVVASMDALEARKDGEIARLKADLSRQFLQHSSHQQEALQLRGEIEDERLAGVRVKCVIGLFEGMCRWRRARLAQTFRVWSGTCTLMSAAEQFRDTLGRAVKRATEDCREEGRAALDELRGVLRNEQEIRVAEVRDEAARSLEAATAEWNESRHALLEERLQALSAKDSEWEVEVNRVRKAGEDSEEEQRRRGEARLEEAEARHLDNLEAARVEVGLALDAAVAETVRNRDSEWADRMAALESDLAVQKSNEISALRDEHARALQQEREAGFQAVVEKAAEMEGRMVEALAVRDEAHSRALASAEETARTLAVEREEALTREEEERLQALRLEVVEEWEGRVKLLRAQWQEEEVQNAKRRDAKLEKVFKTRLDEANKAADLKARQEAERVKDMLAELAIKHEEDCKAAKNAGIEERSVSAAKELKQQADKHSADTQDVIREYRRQLEQQRLDNIVAVDALRETLEADRLAACERTGKEVSSAKDSEWTARLEDAVGRTEAEVRLVWSAKLDRETERLDRFKEDVARQAQHQAQERKDLLDAIARQEDLAKRMEALAAAELDQVKRDGETEKERMRVRFEDNKARALLEKGKEFDTAMEAAEARWRRETESLVLKERQAMQRDAERQLEQLQDESEKLVTELEQALGSTKAEKSALSEELRQTATKLEDAEDALHDEQSMHKRTKAENSIAMWRLVSAGGKLKDKFKETLATVKKEADSLLTSQQAAAKVELDRQSKSVSQLCALIANIEAVRQRMKTTLKSYKAQALLDLRGQIRGCDVEMRRLGEERDALEGRLERLEDEVLGLQTQVREVEEAIREHNSTSAVQNGRINVAHARKKRQLDGDLEGLFEAIEQKRETTTATEDRLAVVNRDRDEKEALLVGLEREFMQVLVDQQRLVAQQIEELDDTDQTVGGIAKVGGFNWPISAL